MKPSYLCHFKLQPSLSFRLIGLVLLLVLSGCSSFKHYPNSLDKNLTATLSEDSDSDVKARVDIYSVDKTCKAVFEGSIRFKERPADIGIPNSEITLLAFYFYNYDSWGNSYSSVNVDALVKSRPGYRYDAKLSYVDSLYELNLYEIHRKSKKRRELKIVTLGACKE